MKTILRKNIFIVFCLSSANLFAQTGTNESKFEFGFNIGIAVYQGDLTPNPLGSFKTKQLYIGAFANRLLTPFFSLRTTIGIGKLKGDDAKYSHPDYRQQRNFNFKSPLLEVSEQVVINILGKNYEEKGLSPYVFAGVGYSFLHIKRDWSNINSTVFPAESDVQTGLAIDAQHSLPKGILVFPLGAGIRYSLTAKLLVNAEAGYRLTNTDYLDGFSQAANPTKKDQYSTYSVGLVYHPGHKNSLKCPVMRY